MTTFPPGSVLPSFLQLYLFGRDIVGSFEKQRKKYGGIFTMRVPLRQKIVVLSDARSISQLLANDADDIPAYPANEWVQCLFGERSMLFKIGAAHRQERKQLKPHLSPDASALIAGQVTQQCRQFLNEQHGEPLPIYDWCYRLTLRTSIHLFWSCSDKAAVREIESVVARARQHYNSFGNMAIDAMALNKTRYPVGARIARLLQKSEHNTLASRFEQVLNRHITEIRRTPDSFPPSPLVSRVLAQTDESEDTDLIHFAMTLLIAATDPPSIISAWLLLHLAKDPELQQRIRLQIQAGKHSALLRSCIFEAYRLYPPLHSITRTLTKQTALGGFDLPAATWIFPSIYLLHRNPDYWDRPDEFVPTRFVDCQQMPELQDGFMPFGGSTHACPGRHFALLEIENIATEVLMTHSLSTDSDITRAKTLGPSLIPSGRETMQLTPLSDATQA
ncbi:MAG: cytochrome P450 [Gammaproteobacteria bacterium]|nr:cytochrome P450 [Gammaproteobacteria bacterium]